MEADWNVIGKIYHHLEGVVEGGVSLKEGKIIKVGRKSTLPKATNTFKRKGTIILPGLIDCHVHLRGLKLFYKEDFYTGTCAAAVGGFTTLVDMPNTDPPTDSSQRLKEKMEDASKNTVVDLGFHVYPTKDENDFRRMVNLGAASVKIYLPEWENYNELKGIVNLCNKLRLPITVHAEDHKVLTENFKRVEEENTLDAFLYVHSPKAEVEGVQETLKIIGSSSIIHFCHVSSKEALKILVNARSKSFNCTVEVTPHHLMLTSKKIGKLGGLGLTVPPLRTKKDTEMLWKGIFLQNIDVIGSDHAPHTIEEKKRSRIWNIPPGIPGLETTLPLLLTFISKGRISLQDLVRLLAENPATIFNLKGKGFIQEGCQGDLTIVDLGSEYILDPQNFHSKAKYSPFSGFKCKGKPRATFVNGILVAEEGEIKTLPGSGRVVKACKTGDSL